MKLKYKLLGVIALSIVCNSLASQADAAPVRLGKQVIKAVTNKHVYTVVRSKYLNPDFFKKNGEKREPPKTKPWPKEMTYAEIEEGVKNDTVRVFSEEEVEIFFKEMEAYHSREDIKFW
jgi:hypothetical protein